MSANLGIMSTMATRLEKFSFYSNPKKGNAKKCSNYHQLHSFHMLVILCSKFFKLGFSSTRTKDFQRQARFQNHKGIRDQVVNISWIIEKAKEFHKNTYFCFIDYTKAFDHVDHNKLWKILKDMEVPDHLICILRNLCVGQEATVRTRYGTNNLVQNWGMSMTRLYIATLLT